MPAVQKIAVAGSTGRVGRHIVDVLEERGHEVVPISRSVGVDLITGEGLAEALVGVDAVVDSATSPSPDEQEATEFFTIAARNLQQVGARAGVRRIVAVSIIGTDLFTGGYGLAKQVHERETLSGPIPAVILRAAQFHEFVEQLVEWGTQDGVSYVPRMRTQLVAARAVAEVAADLATGPEAAFAPGAPTPEIAGPREENLVVAAGLLAARRGDPTPIVDVPVPEEFYGDLNETGGLLPAPGAILAGPTFEEWLREEYSVSAADDLGATA